MTQYKTPHGADEIADELHLSKYPKGPTLEEAALRASARHGILEAACGHSLKLDRIVYHVREPATFAIWKRDDG